MRESPATFEPKQTGRVVLLDDSPAPYRVPVYNHLNHLLGGRLSVMFTTTSWPERSWTVPVHDMKFDWRFLVRRTGSSHLLGQGRIAAALLDFLIRSRPGAMICGNYDTLAAWVSFTWCKLLGVQFVLWMESNARDHRRPSRTKTWLKRFIISKSDAVASPGKATIEYAKMLGGDEKRMSVVRNGFDVEFFARESAKVDARLEKELHGYPAALLLFAGRLVRMKGVFVLLEAFRRVSAELSDVGLLIVGHGAEQEAMKALCRNTGLERVYFAGPQPYERMPYYYALADVMVLPTLSDPHPLCIGEAFACGTPVIVSRVAGACDDLIVQGETGFTVEPGDPADLSNKILQVLRGGQLRIYMGQNCRALIQAHTAECTAQRLFDIVLGTKIGAGYSNHVIATAK